MIFGVFPKFVGGHGCYSTKTFCYEPPVWVVLHGAHLGLPFIRGVPFTLLSPEVQFYTHGTFIYIELNLKGGDLSIYHVSAR